MAKKLKIMKLETFIKKILSGEREFKEIRFPSNMNLRDHDSYADLQNYLLNQDFLNNPLNFTYSSLRGLIAPKLNLSYINANLADFANSKISGSNLSKSYLCDVNFTSADLRSIDFTDSMLRGADMSDADLRNSELKGSVLHGTDFTRTDIRGSTGFSKSRALGYAHFNSTKATVKEEQEIRNYLDNSKWFDILII